MATVKTSTSTCLSDTHLVEDKLTMSSVEIAELTGKLHRNVLRDITKMFKELEIGALNFERSYKSKQGKELACFKLPKRECLILVSGYSIKMRAAIIDRWQALEDQQAPTHTPKPTTAPQSTPKQLTCKGETIPLLTDKQQYWLPLEPLCQLLQINYYAMVKSVGKLNIKLQSIKHDNKTWLCIALNDASTWLNSINVRYYQLVKRKQLIENIETLLAHIATVQTQTTAPAAAKPATVESLLYAFEQVIGEPVVVITKKQARQTIENVGNVDPKRLCAFDLRAFTDNYREQLDFVQNLLHDKGAYHLPKLPA